ncbi:MAG: lycopene beta-cyclase CrtY [Myxococcota bacterium]|nr:lycopene beta-cyclase CrtY [Myxococcota bacterium]
MGGGLQNGLVALAVRARQPAARIVMIDRGPRPGGNHTWCFHAADVGAEMDWIDPIVATRWDGYDVAFPDLRRRVDSPYACVTSERLADHVLSAVDQYVCATATEVGANRVIADDEFVGAAVIDARGPEHGTPTACGWQKFLGQELRLAAPHGLERPMLMDATLPQTDGFRFMYVLPLAPDRVLVEDTYFSDTAYLDAAALRVEIEAYARRWDVVGVDREETGVLPLPWKTQAAAATAPLVGGYAGGWFHPVTGYSFPIAARFAARIASVPAAQLYEGALDELVETHNSQLGFALRLNKMLFHWFRPEHRFHVLQRFYRLPEAVIRRFYALELTALDRARIIIGRPPRGLSLRAALEAR